MGIGLVVEDCAAYRDADRAAQVAHHVEQAAGIFEPLRPQAAKPEHHRGRHDEHLRKAAQHLGQDQFGAAPCVRHIAESHIAAPKLARPAIISQRVSMRLARKI